MQILSLVKPLANTISPNPFQRQMKLTIKTAVIVGLNKMQTRWQQMAVGGWKNADDKTWMEKCGWKIADGKMWMNTCGWKNANDNLWMIKS